MSYTFESSDTTDKTNEKLRDLDITANEESFVKLAFGVCYDAFPFGAFIGFVLSIIGCTLQIIGFSEARPILSKYSTQDDSQAVTNSLLIVAGLLIINLAVLLHGIAIFILSIQHRCCHRNTTGCHCSKLQMQQSKLFRSVLKMKRKKDRIEETHSHQLKQIQIHQEKIATEKQVKENEMTKMEKWIASRRQSAIDATKQRLANAHEVNTKATQEQRSCNYHCVTILVL